ncbi:MAG: GNAT family N-acetyltransferase [Chloracidobacterium sp.]|nr:GNAT family N-acetyltransferase [Chloracidobacterium sp.]
MILETERLRVRELDEEKDAEFMHRLLNSPKFIRFIGDRNVRSVEESRIFIRDRYRTSYKENGYGLYAVELKAGAGPSPVGICGFVRRDSLPHPDLGFAFLPEHEGYGYGHESARALMNYSRDTLKFTKLLAITTIDNEASEKLLMKLGFVFEGIREMSVNEKLKVFSADLI